MKIYIVRHGQVRSNALNMYNSEDEDLTDKGVEQANELKEKTS
jgi:broad specificity phosphatase PhoE